MALAPRKPPVLPLDANGIAQVDLGDRVQQIVASLGRIDTENLKQEVEDIGASSVWWGLLTAEAKRQAGVAAMEEELVGAQLNKRLREEAVARGEKPTVDQIAASIVIDGEMQTAKLKTLNAEANASMIESTKYALVQKGKTLEALAGLIVDELRARVDPTTRPVLRTPVR